MCTCCMASCQLHADDSFAAVPAISRSAAAQPASSLPQQQHSQPAKEQTA